MRHIQHGNLLQFGAAILLDPIWSVNIKVKATRRSRNFGKTLVFFLDHISVWDERSCFTGEKEPGRENIAGVGEGFSRCGRECRLTRQLSHSGTFLSMSSLMVMPSSSSTHITFNLSTCLQHPYKNPYRPF